MKLYAYCSAVIACFLATTSFAADITIEMLNKDQREIGMFTARRL